MSNNPNILVISSDTHAAFLTGCYGSNWIKTPNIDKLASEGILFSKAYCQNPLCLPSRQSLITGLYSFQNGIHHNDHMTADMYTMGHHFKKAGYDTAAFGKMHFISDTDCSRNKERNWGFDTRIDYEEYWDFLIHKCGCKPLEGYSEDPYDIIHLEKIQHILQAELVKTEERPENDTTNPFPRTGTLPHKYHQEALVLQNWNKFLTQERNNPFLTFVSFQSPHPPHLPPIEFLSLYEDIDLPLMAEADQYTRNHPVWKNRSRPISEAEQKQFFKYYGAFISYTDWCVGEALRILEESGQAENTLIVYFSDHGDMSNAHGMRGKICFYEESVRVPLIIKQPGNNRNGIKYHGLVELIDIFPTFCDASNIEIPENLPGRSLWCDLINHSDTGKEYVFSEIYRMSDRLPWWPSAFPESFSMIMNNDYKLIDYGNGLTDLFDVSKDPENHVNLSEMPKHQNIKEKLLAEIHRKKLQE